MNAMPPIEPQGFEPSPIPSPMSAAILAELATANGDTQPTPVVTEATITSSSIPESAQTQTEIVTAEDENSSRELFEGYLIDLPDSLQNQFRKRFEDALQNPNAVAGITKVRGLVFEVSRIHKVIAEGQENVDFELKTAPLEVRYTGFPKRGADFAQPPNKDLQSQIDLDVPIRRGDMPFVYEVKSAPRLPYGSLPEQRNQLLKYQAAVEANQVSGATVEIEGRIDPSFLAWANGHGIDDLGPIPNVEIIYTLMLPSGNEYRFVLKRAAGNNGLKFENPTPDNSDDRRAIKGIHKAILDRSIIAILTDKPASDSTEMQAYLDNPMSIDSPDAYDEFTELYTNTILHRLSEKADVIVNLSNEFAAYSDAVTPTYIEQTLREVQDYLHQNPKATQAQRFYLLSEAEVPMVLAEVTRRIEIIRSHELARMASPQEQERAAERSAMGYASTLPPEGTALNVEHIIMDSIQSIKKNQNGRDYISSDQFPTVEAITAQLTNEIDRSYRIVTIYDPVTGKTEQLKDISEQGYQKKVASLLKTNVLRAIQSLESARGRHDELAAQSIRSPKDEHELLRLGSLARGLNQHSKNISSLQAEIAELEKTKVDKIKQAQASSEKADIRIAYDAKIQERYARLREILIPSVGGQIEWDNIAQRITEDKAQNIIKYIYAVDADGVIRVDEEKVRGEVTGRAAHSELVGGQNVYGAGELVFTKIDGVWRLTEINNGSGHYRPSALTLPYVANLLEHRGVDTSSVILVDSLQRGAQLAEASMI